MENTTITYKKNTKNYWQKLLYNFFGDKKSQNCLVVGQTPVKNLQNS